VKTSVEAKISALKALKDSTDKAAIEKASTELSEELMKIGDAMMKKEEPASAEGSGETKPSGEEGNVRDADFKEGENK
jgi:hypothetical protein